MKLSISTFLYINYPLDEAIKRIAGLGYDGVEIWGGRPHAYCEDIEEEEAARLRKLTEKVGLEISGFIPAQFRYPTCLCSANSKIRTASVQYIRKSIITAKMFGCRIVSICPGHTLWGQGYESGIKALAESVRELLLFAQENQILLLIEPAHPFETDIIVTVDDAIRFIRDYGFGGLGVVLDSGHCFVNKESLPDCVVSLKNLPFHIHIDDNLGQSDDHMVPGEGGICFEPFLKSLLQEKYNGFLTAELGWGYTAEPDAAAYRCKKVFDSVMRSI